MAFFTQSIIPKHDVKQAPKNREKQDGNNPGQLIGGVHALIDDQDHHEQTQQNTEPIEVNEVSAESENDANQQE